MRLTIKIYISKKQKSQKRCKNFTSQKSKNPKKDVKILHLKKAKFPKKM